MLTDTEVLMSAFAGGSIAAMAIAFVLFQQIKFAYDERLRILDAQIMTIRLELNMAYDRN